MLGVVKRVQWKLTLKQSAVSSNVNILNLINEKKKEPDAYDISQYSKGISILLSIPDTYCWS